MDFYVPNVDKVTVFLIPPLLKVIITRFQNRVNVIKRPKFRLKMKEIFFPSIAYPG